MGAGFTEAEVLDMPLNKYNMYIGAAIEVEYTRRRGFVMDVSAAIGTSLTGKGLEDYIKALTSEE